MIDACACTVVLAVHFENRLCNVMANSRTVHSCQGGTACSCGTKLQAALLKYFGYSQFRDGQKEASLAIMHKQDVFVRMATGSGKTLCMFLGPLAISHVAVGVIISPLNGLMEQQVRVGIYINLVQ